MPGAETPYKVFLFKNEEVIDDDLGERYRPNISTGFVDLTDLLMNFNYTRDIEDGLIVSKCKFTISNAFGVFTASGAEYSPDDGYQTDSRFSSQITLRKGMSIAILNYALDRVFYHGKIDDVDEGEDELSVTTNDYFQVWKDYHRTSMYIRDMYMRSPTKWSGQNKDADDYLIQLTYLGEILKDMIYTSTPFDFLYNFEIDTSFDSIGLADDFYEEFKFGSINEVIQKFSLDFGIQFYIDYSITPDNEIMHSILYTPLIIYEDNETPTHTLVDQRYFSSDDFIITETPSFSVKEEDVKNVIEMDMELGILPFYDWDSIHTYGKRPLRVDAKLVDEKTAHELARRLLDNFSKGPYSGDFEFSEPVDGLTGEVQHFLEWDILPSKIVAVKYPRQGIGNSTSYRNLVVGSQSVSYDGKTSSSISVKSSYYSDDQIMKNMGISDKEETEEANTSGEDDEVELIKNINLQAHIALKDIEVREYEVTALSEYHYNRDWIIDPEEPSTFDTFQMFVTGGNIKDLTDIYSFESVNYMHQGGGGFDKWYYKGYTYASYKIDKENQATIISDGGRSTLALQVIDIPHNHILVAEQPYVPASPGIFSTYLVDIFISKRSKVQLRYSERIYDAPSNTFYEDVEAKSEELIIDAGGWHSLELTLSWMKENDYTWPVRLYIEPLEPDSNWEAKISNFVAASAWRSSQNWIESSHASDNPGNITRPWWNSKVYVDLFFDESSSVTELIIPEYITDFYTRFELGDGGAGGLRAEYETAGNFGNLYGKIGIGISTDEIHRPKYIEGAPGGNFRGIYDGPAWPTNLIPGDRFVVGENAPGNKGSIYTYNSPGSATLYESPWGDADLRWGFYAYCIAGPPGDPNWFPVFGSFNEWIHSVGCKNPSPYDSVIDTIFNSGWIVSTWVYPFALCPNTNWFFARGHGNLDEDNNNDNPTRWLAGPGGNSYNIYLESVTLGIDTQRFYSNDPVNEYSAWFSKLESIYSLNQLPKDTEVQNSGFLIGIDSSFATKSGSAPGWQCRELDFDLYGFNDGQTSLTSTSGGVLEILDRDLLKRRIYRDSIAIRRPSISDVFNPFIEIDDLGTLFLRKLESWFLEAKIMEPIKYVLLSTSDTPTQYNSVVFPISFEGALDFSGSNSKIKLKVPLKGWSHMTTPATKYVDGSSFYPSGALFTHLFVVNAFYYFKPPMGSVEFPKMEYNAILKIALSTPIEYGKEYGGNEQFGKLIRIDINVQRDEVTTASKYTGEYSEFTDDGLKCVASRIIRDSSPNGIYSDFSYPLSLAMLGVNYYDGKYDYGDVDGVIEEWERKGEWDASNNIPFLQSSIGEENSYYLVAVSGSTNLNGISTWQVDDLAYFQGGVWNKKLSAARDPIETKLML